MHSLHRMLVLSVSADNLLYQMRRRLLIYACDIDAFLIEKEVTT
jgi:hypothetical protein